LSQRIRSRLHGEEGFTLIELLVVILIIGILAAIAIPSFLNQKGKANDASAKSDARTAQTAMETYYTDHGTYTGATTAKLQAIEPSLGSDVSVPTSGTGVPSDTGYAVTATSSNGNRTFTITKAGSAVTRTCHVPSGTNAGGCVDPNGSGDGSW
jgi:type IV pilus assembly protein PilA